MCGIVGIINSSDGLKYVHKMLDQILHRGPDNHSVTCVNNVYFGHSRLSILDHSSLSNQPILSTNKNLLLTFNGEIYNWESLREVIGDQYNFQTQNSDTETLLAAYQVYGKNVLSKLRGPFAFAIYDKKLDKVLIARDSIGEKPIYYSFLPEGGLVFASEVKALSPVCRAKVSEQQLYRYMSFLTPEPGKSMFNNIFKLRPGHYIELDISTNLKEIKQEVFWDVSDVLNETSKAEYLDIIEFGGRRLEESVAKQCNTDTDIAVALSGGLDSSLNLDLSEKELVNRCDKNSLFSINAKFTSADPEKDESRIAAQFSADKKIPLLDVELDSKKFWQEFDFLAENIFDCPIIWPDMVLVSAISRKLSDRSIKVLLVGEGGDELGAYASYFSFLNNVREKRGYSLSGEFISSRHIIGFSEDDLEKYWVGEQPKVSNFKKILDLQKTVKISGDEGLIRQVLNLEYKLRLPELLLQRLDLASMLHGIEARAPFLDIDLIESILPTSFFIRNKDELSKAWLKDYAKNKLPDYITSWPKLGFGHEFNKLLQTELYERFLLEVVQDDQAPIHQYLSSDFFKLCVSRHRRRGNYGHRLWVIYTLNIWLKKMSEFAAEGRD